jgi:hypothetical protein
MSTRAYENDPRIKRELVREEEEKLAAKEAKKIRNALKHAKVNEVKVDEAALKI